MKVKIQLSNPIYLYRPIYYQVFAKYTIKPHEKYIGFYPLLSLRYRCQQFIAVIELRIGCTIILTSIDALVKT
jgi:hypothetical protein